jgi:4-aminobutyrate aminotransferase-like enzyme
MLSRMALEISQQVAATIQGCEGIRAPNPERLADSQTMIDRMGQLRGRPLLYPMMPTGRGSGPYIEMMDGSVKLDLITGIGVSLFGYNHPELVMEALKASLRAPVTQGTLMPGKDFLRLSQAVLNGANGEGLSHLPAEAKAKLAGVWMTSCGTMANELALKIVRQKKSPAFKCISFKNAFAGRSSTMGELTDEPNYRQGQPVFDQFKHIDFYEEELGVAESAKRACAAIDAILDAEPGQYAAFGFEPIQGEGGAFKHAPREWWLPVLEHARSKGLAIWFDEVQTYGRTGELFAFQRLGLGAYVDVVSLAKPLHAAAVAWTADYAPKPGLIGGTFAASGSNLAVGSRIMEMLIAGAYLGPEGRIQKMEAFIKKDWEERKARIGARYNFGRLNIYGGMIAMEMLDGSAETMKKLLARYFEKGVLAFSAGKKPVYLRFLPPMGVFTETHWHEAMRILEETLEEFSAESKSS